MASQLSILAVGECMLELNEAVSNEPGSMRVAFGGDTLNTTIYLARLLAGRGHDIAYLTALGDDPYSAGMVAAWRDEGIATDRVHRLADRLPGLYAIRTSGDGERAFFYWRDQAAARELFTTKYWRHAVKAVAAADLIYLSGISVSILPPEGRERLRQALGAAKQRGAEIVFDLNYRPRGWRDAAEACEELLPYLLLCDRFLPSFEDIRALFTDASPEAAVRRLSALAIKEVVVKDGAGGCWLARGDEIHHVPALAGIAPLDTTAAGDSFNAAYLAARVGGLDAVSAARFAHKLAARVIVNRGAIIAPAAMSDLALPLPLQERELR